MEETTSIVSKVIHNDYAHTESHKLNQNSFLCYYILTHRESLEDTRRELSVQQKKKRSVAFIRVFQFIPPQPIKMTSAVEC